MMFDTLENIFSRPEPYEFYTASDLWTDEHTSQQMLTYHLNGDIDVSSRKTEFIERSVSWIAKRFNVGPGTKIADFGCGPGLYASRLARLKADVTAIDFSKRSIGYARQKTTEEGLAVNYINENYLDFESDERFDLIIMIMCDFCALSPTQRAGLLAKFHKLLSPGGCVLLDVYSLQAFAKREEGASCQPNQLHGFWSPNKYYGFLNTFKYETEKVMLDKFTIIEADRTRTVYNWLQYFSKDSLTGELTAANFTIADFHNDVAGTAFSPDGDEFAVIASK
jgi:cyclopropane fatty-acyl-phospholipid synthase-like methyltransferase